MSCEQLIKRVEKAAIRFMNKRYNSELLMGFDNDICDSLLVFYKEDQHAFQFVYVDYNVGTLPAETLSLEDDWTRKEIEIDMSKFLADNAHLMDGTEKVELYDLALGIIADKRALVRLHIL